MQNRVLTQALQPRRNRGPRASLSRFPSGPEASGPLGKRDTGIFRQSL